MSKNSEYEHVGRVDILREKPKLKTNWGEVFGGIFIVIFVIAILSSCN